MKRTKHFMRTTVVSRGSVKHMLKVADKKPALKMVIDAIEKYTKSDIDGMTEFPSWIRKRLKQYQVTEMINVPDAKSEIHVRYPVSKYTGEDTYLRTSGSSLLIEHGDLVMKVDDGTYRIAMSLVYLGVEEQIFIKNSTEYIDTMYISEYNESHQKHICEKHDLAGNNTDDGYDEYGYLKSIKFG